MRRYATVVMSDWVELRGARIPFLGWIAHHYWFVIHRSASKERWEVWQRPNGCATSRDHLHQNLLSWDVGVGGGSSWSTRVWRHADANELIEQIQQSMETYPWCGEYRYWPGPNSNTYVQWILGDRYRLPWRGIGRAYVRNAPQI